MLIFTNIKMAFASLRSSKLRSSLTMLGIIIGVVSVVTFMSFGQGLKNQVTDEIRELGDDYLQISPGELVTRDEEGNVEEFDFTAMLGATPFTIKDLTDIQAIENISVASGVQMISGEVATNKVESPSSSIVATTPDIQYVYSQEVEDGTFLDDNIKNDFVVVLGKKVSVELFGEDFSGIGRTVQIRGQDFTVIGVMAQHDSILASASSGNDFNSFAFVTLEAGKQLTKAPIQLLQIDLKVADIEKTDETIDEISTILETNRGDTDFTVTKPEELLAFTDSILGLLTTVVVAIASISVLVGGVGIMNIMFVTVSERTREIGIRKAIGATNNQILFQFLIESIVLTIFGTAIGFAISVIISSLTRIYTDFKPAITLESIIVASTAAIIFGVVFGIVPAAKAAKKDPIQALRHE